MERKLILEKAAESSVRTIIASKGGNPEGEIFSQLELLADFVEKYGEKRYYLPLQAKKLLCTMLDADYRIEYKVAKTAEVCEVEALLYWSDSEHPSGVGFVRRSKSEILPTDALTSEERENLLEATCRGLAASRAITDAGIGGQLLGEVDSKELESEKADQQKSLDISMTTDLPTIPSPNEKKALRRERSEVKITVTEEVVPPVIETTASHSPAVEKEPEGTPEQMSFEDMFVPETMPEMADLSDEFSKVADIGTLKGNTLGDIYKSQPRYLLQLVKNGSAVAKEARTICLADPNGYGLAAKLS